MFSRAIVPELMGRNGEESVIVSRVLRTWGESVVPSPSSTRGGRVGESKASSAHASIFIARTPRRALPAKAIDSTSP